jgi:protein SCO1/2
MNMLRFALVFVLAVRAFGGACCPAPTTSAAAGAAVVAWPETSLHHVPATWQTDTGATVTLAAGAGRVRVIALFYSYCPSACPRLLAKLRAIESALSPAARERVDFILVSLDPTHDTPAVLHAYRERQQLPEARWQLLTGSPADVRSLAALLDVRFKPEAAGTIAHTNLFSVLGRDGQIAWQEAGLADAPPATVARLETLALAP